MSGTRREIGLGEAADFKFQVRFGGKAPFRSFDWAQPFSPSSFSQRCCRIEVSNAQSVSNYLLYTKDEVMLGRNWCDFPWKWTPFTGIESGTYFPAHSYSKELGVVYLLERSNCRSGRFATDVGIIDWNNKHVARNQAMML